jgi:hypothetical protein
VPHFVLNEARRAPQWSVVRGPLDRAIIVKFTRQFGFVM